MWPEYGARWLRFAVIRVQSNRGVKYFWMEEETSDSPRTFSALGRAKHGSDRE
jgi:hypothetical protein